MSAGASSPPPPPRDAEAPSGDAVPPLDATPSTADMSSADAPHPPADTGPPSEDGAASDASMGTCGADEPGECDTCVVLTSMGDTEVTVAGALDGPGDTDCFRFHLDDDPVTDGDELRVAVLTTPRYGVSLTLYQSIVPCRAGTPATLNLSECTAPIGALASCGDRPDYMGSDETGDYFLFVHADGAPACLPYDLYVSAGI